MCELTKTNSDISNCGCGVETGLIDQDGLLNFHEIDWSGTGEGLRVGDVISDFVLSAVLAQWVAVGPDTSQRGCDSACFNEMLMSLPLAEVLRFRWKRDGHINVLETSALLIFLKSIAGGGGFGQLVSVGLDSRVALCATAKGRSSATALGPVTRGSRAPPASARSKFSASSSLS